MTQECYDIFGTSVSRLLGRSQELAEIQRRWKKNHISVVGPKYYGKTVLLHHLAKIGGQEADFAAVVLWKEEDLRGNPPRNDAEFWAALRSLLESQAPVAVEFLPKNAAEANAESMLDVFRFLAADGKRILLIWDGLDECLMQGDLSPNLWNQLTKLANTQSATLVVSTRKKLIDLVPTEEAKGSDFWRRFSLVVDLGCYIDKDWPEVIAPLGGVGIKCDASACKELTNWTGGIPLLASALCNRLATRSQAGSTITKSDVDQAATTMEHRCVELLWRDVPEELREDFADIARKQVISKGQLNALRAEELLARGLVSESGGNFRPSAKLMAQYAIQVIGGMPELRRHFGTDETFLQNIQGVLELRLSQVGPLDAELKYHVSQIVKSLDHPSTAMELMRGVFDRAATFILKADFSTGKIPTEWVSAWKMDGKLNSPDRDRDILQCKIPNHRGNRIKLLGLLFDHKTAGESKFRQSTFHLLEFVFKAGTYGEHAVEIDEEVPLQFAISATFAAIELCHHLVAETR